MSTERRRRSGQAFFDGSFVRGFRNYWKSHDFAGLHDGVIDAILDFVTRVPDPQCNIVLGQMGGASARVPKEATAYGRRDAEWVLNVHGRWADPARDSETIAWARGLFQATAPYATGGVYVNFMTADEAERAPDAFGSNYARLLDLKRRYDPANLFRVNVNIRPTVSAA